MIGQPFTGAHAGSQRGAPVAISLFGPLVLTVNGQVVTRFRSNKTRALLAYLLLAHPQPIARTTVSELLWSGFAEQSAQANLRQSLTNLRECLAPFELIERSRTQLHLRHDPAILWCDVHEFERLLDLCHTHEHERLSHCKRCRARLQEAVALYTGPLLATFADIDSAPFTAWLNAQRTRLAHLLAEVQALLAAGSTVRGNLPVSLTPLVGRTAELTRLERNLQHMIYRCTSLVGPGGIGKTRLACALVAPLQPHFPDGIWLIELSGLAPTTPDEPPTLLHDRLATAIGQTLGVTFAGSASPAAQVANFLRTKVALLILDSFEHLLAAAAWLPTLLTAATQVRLLITTRHRLPLQSQLVYGVQGLGIPPEVTADYTADYTIDHLLTQYASLQLFVERAESAGISLPLDQENLIAISQLCRFVGGSPWAIELAVALLDRQSPATILAAIQANYRALTSHLLDLPLRQRSAAAVFQTSWALLAPVEAQTLARCALFRGGFTLAAAQQVAGATLHSLEALVHKSLLQHGQVDRGAVDRGAVDRGSAERYVMHDLVRQFAEEQLAQTAHLYQGCQLAHAAYFTGLLATWRPADDFQQRFRTAIAAEWDNVQAAWAWAVERGAVALLQQSLKGLVEYYNGAALYREADVLLGRAVTRIRALLAAANPTAGPTESRHLQTLLAHLLCSQAGFINQALLDFGRAQPLIEEALQWAQTLADGALAARCYSELAIGAHYQGDAQRQAVLAQQAFALAQQSGTLFDQAIALNILGFSQLAQGDHAAALASFHAALPLTRQGVYGQFEFLFLNNIGNVHLQAGHFTTALPYYQQALARAEAANFSTMIAAILHNLGMIALLVGDYGAAHRRLLTAYQHAVDHHHQSSVAEIVPTLAMLFYELGEDATAIDYAEQALVLAGEQLYETRVSALSSLGHLYRRQGEWAAAADVYQQALTLSQTAQRALDELLLQIYLAAVTFGRGDALAALAAVEPQLAKLAATTLPHHQRIQELYLILYQILSANADPRAQTVLHQAWAYVQSQAAKLDDPQLRDSFLTNVPVNRALAQLIAAHPHRL